MANDERGPSSVRQLTVRDRLWQTFVQMSEEQDKSVEDLISDAMSAYAQLAGYETAVHAETPAPAAGPGHGVRPQPFAPPVPPPSRLGRPTAPAQGPSPPPPPDAGLGPSVVYLVFDNQKYRIDKDQFIIGRGSKSSDLPIKDGNISRKHAAVVRRNGAFFIKDLGSTNGIDYKGMRIDNKRIDEGDVFHICEYELKFTYKR